MPAIAATNAARQRDLGLAEADVADHEPVHRLARAEVLDDIADRAVLVLGLLVREAIDEAGIAAAVGFEHVAGLERALGRDRDQLARDLADALLHAALAPLPRLAAEPVERRAVLARAVARQDLEILDRHVQLVAAGIFQRDAIVRALADRDRCQPDIAADAVIGMNDEVAGRQRRQFGEEGVGRFAALGAADQPVAEHVLLGQHREIGGGEAVLQREHDQRHPAAERLLPAVCQPRAGQAMVLEQSRQPLARAGRVAGEHHLAARALFPGDMLGDRFVQIDAAATLGREVARTVDAQIDDRGGGRFVEQRGQMRLRRRIQLGELVDLEVQRLLRQRSIAARLGRLGAAAVFPIIGDRLEPLLGRARHAAVADDDCPILFWAEMVVQGAELLLEQRQPMFHACQPPPVADRLIERIARGGRAEALAVAAAEAFDRLLVEQRFRRGQQRETVETAGGALILGREAAHAFDLVAEEVEAQRLFLAAREQIDDAAAHGIFALVMDGVGADITIGLEQRRQLVAPDPLARRQRRDELADAERGEDALGGGVGGGDDQLRPGRLALEAMQHGDPFGHDTQGGRGAVIGQAVPGGEAEHLQFGREERRGGGDGAHRRLVRRDEHGAALSRLGRGAREVGEQRGEEAGGNAGEGEGLAGREDGGEGRHWFFRSLSPSGEREGADAVGGRERGWLVGTQTLSRLRFARHPLPQAGEGNQGTFTKSMRRIACIIAPSHRAGHACTPIAHAMMSTSCSSRNASNQPS